ncbi:MAG: hypothetical protein WCD79_04005 [Chthoniobacteraceae bacterium]
MITTWRSQPRQFGAIAFGLLGLAFGLMKTSPWNSDGIFLVRAFLAKLFWAFLIAGGSAALGYRNGTRFIHNASRANFAGAGGTAAFALARATVITIFVYCVALVVTGDFGVSLGVFGTFQPPCTIFQKFMAIIVIFFTGFWFFILGAVIFGFIGGYLLALLFAPAYRDDQA